MTAIHPPLIIIGLFALGVAGLAYPGVFFVPGSPDELLFLRFVSLWLVVCGAGALLSAVALALWDRRP